MSGWVCDGRVHARAGGLEPMLGSQCQPRDPISKLH